MWITFVIGLIATHYIAFKLGKLWGKAEEQDDNMPMDQMGT